MSDLEKHESTQLGPETSNKPGTGEAIPYIDPVLEKKVLRKIDKWLLPHMMLLVLMFYLDRRNARVFGFEEGIGLVGTQFNDLSTVFFATYVVCEIPWVMAVKRFGANYVLACAMISWSTITLGFGFVKNYPQALVLRILLGVAEAGLIPAVSFIQRTVWDRESMAKRTALIYVAICMSGAFGGMIAYGIQSMGDRHGLSAWKWLFIVEDVIYIARNHENTKLHHNTKISRFLPLSRCSHLTPNPPSRGMVSVILFFTLPTFAEKAWFLNEEERALMRARKVRDAAFQGTYEFDWDMAKRAFTDPIVYFSAALMFAGTTPLFGFSTFLPTILQGMGHIGLEANYLSIPPYVFASIALLFRTTISDKLKKRALIAFLVPLPAVIGYAIVVGTPNAPAGYFAMFLCAGVIYPYNAVMLSWVANNLAPDDKRSVGIPLVASIANISGALASQIYKPTDAPRYIMGNAVSLGMDAVAVGGVIVLWMILVRRDKAKAKLEAEGVEDNGYAGEDRGIGFKYVF